MSDDYRNDTQTTGTVSVGGSTTGEIEVADDQDWFRVSLDAGKTYRIDLEGSSTDDGTLSVPHLRVYDGDGNWVGVYDSSGDWVSYAFDTFSGVGTNSRFFFDAETAGTYYIAASGHQNRTGTYRLSVTEIGDDDYSADTDTTGTVAVDGSETGEIERHHDHDWFSVSLQAGKAYRIDLEGSSTGAGTLPDPYLRGVYDENGDLIQGTVVADGGVGKNAGFDFEPEATGTYYIAAGAFHTGIGTYRVSVAELTSDDYAAATHTSGTVEVNDSASGEIQYEGDADWFAVTLAAGNRYQFDLEGASTSAGTLVDPTIYGLYDADGNRLPGRTYNDAGGEGKNSRLVFDPKNTGTYYISAAGDNDDNVGTYRLSLTQVQEGDDFSADTGTTGTVSVDGSTAGEIDRAYDRDWFEITLQAGKIYQIDLRGASTGDGTLSDPHLRGVYDADGNLVSGTSNNNAGTGLNSYKRFEADATGTYYIAAGATGNGTGTYRVAVTELADDFSADTDTTGRVVAGRSATGEIEYPYDRDWFEVTLQAGKTYRIDLEGSSTGDGTLSNPCLRGVYDEDGARFRGTANNDGGTGYNSRLYFDPPTTGTYYIAAGAKNKSTGTYRLSVTEADDDFSANNQTTGTLDVGGSATGEIDRPYDRDWFAVDLVAGNSYRIDLEGSPTNSGTLRDAFIRGVYEDDGTRIPGNSNDDGGVGLNSRLKFDAENTATYYIAAGAYGAATGTYEISVEEVM